MRLQLRSFRPWGRLNQAQRETILAMLLGGAIGSLAVLAVIMGLIGFGIVPL